MKWLVLGGDGMVGGTVCRYLKFVRADFAATQRRHHSQKHYLSVDLCHVGVAELRALFSGFDVVVNGIVGKQLQLDSLERYRSDFFVNAYFPHLAARAAALEGIRFIHISTDGVFSGQNGPYDESSDCDGQDHYAVSKRLGEVKDSGSLNIRCSVVGHEISLPRSLLGWFLSQRGDVRGYTDQIWNGVTCLQLAQFIGRIAAPDLFNELAGRTKVIHFSPNPPMSKYDLLCSIREIYGGEQCVLAATSGTAISRVLATLYRDYYESVVSFTQALREQRDFEEKVLGENRL